MASIIMFLVVLGYRGYSSTILVAQRCALLERTEGFDGVWREIVVCTRRKFRDGNCLGSFPLRHVVSMLGNGCLLR